MTDIKYKDVVSSKNHMLETTRYQSYLAPEIRGSQANDPVEKQHVNTAKNRY